MRVVFFLGERRKGKLKMPDNETIIDCNIIGQAAIGSCLAQQERERERKRGIVVRVLSNLQMRTRKRDRGRVERSTIVCTRSSRRF